MKVLKWIFKIVLSLAIVVALLVGGVFLFVKIKYDINQFALISEVNILSKQVNEDEMYKNKFSKEDMASAKQVADEHMLGLITYDETNATYKIGDGVSAPLALNNMNLTDKQCGAILNTLLNQGSTTAQVTIGDKTINVNLVQVSFVKFDEKPTTTTIHLLLRIE